MSFSTMAIVSIGTLILMAIWIIAVEVRLYLLTSRVMALLKAARRLQTKVTRLEDIIRATQMQRTTSIRKGAKGEK